MTVYMAVTADEYELPVAVADSVKELALSLGVSSNSVYHALWRHDAGKVRRIKFIETKI